MSELTIRALLSAYAAYGPRVVFSTPHRQDVQCATCAQGCIFPGGAYLLENGIRHTADCPVKDMERALHSEGYVLRCMHPETLSTSTSP